MKPIFPPAGAAYVEPWRDDDDGLPVRGFVGRIWDGPTEVRIEGTQSLYRGITRTILIGDEKPLTVAQAREVARALIAAADECLRNEECNEQWGEP